MKENKTVSIWKIMLTFIKIGVFTFGSGLAMIPMVKMEVVTRKEWATEEEIVDMVTISEATPGPIMVNLATFIGYKLRGIPGGIMATVGVVIPSFVWISIVALSLNQFENNQYVQYAFSGIRVGVLALIGKAIITVYKQCDRNIFSYIILIVAFIYGAINRFSIVYAIIMSAFVGIIYGWIMKKNNIAKSEKKEAENVN